MSSFISWILSCLLNSLWQIPLLFAAGWLAARAMRKISAAAEHRVWVSVLVLSTLLPILSTLPFEDLFARLGWSGARTPVEPHVSVIVGAGYVQAPFSLPDAFLLAIAVTWFIVCLWFAARFAWRSMRLRALRLDATVAALTGEAAIHWAQCSSRFKVDGVLIATSSRVFGPVTMGLRRRMILLPAAMLSEISETEFHAVVAHEFAHIRRNDFLKNLLYELIALPVSYHPLLWAIRERIMETREMVCDQMAAGISGRSQYARSLLRLAALLVEGTRPGTAHAIGIFDANTFERRLMRLTEQHNEMGGVRRLAIVAACAIFGVAISASALAVHLRVNGLAADVKPPAQPSEPVAVSPQIMQGQRIGGPMPKYPEAAKKAKIQGTVVLDAVIGKDGTVEKLTVVSGPSALQSSALDAVKDWIYKPFLLNGDPVEVKTTINVIYSLAK